MSVEAPDNGSIELGAIIQEIRDRVRSRHPDGTIAGGIPVPDLMPLLHARDAAEGKVASIGTVNPRAGGLANSLIQKVKRLVSRALDWHVREQVEFNRAVLGCVQATIEALNENKRGMLALNGRLDELAERHAREMHQQARDFTAEARELKDIRTHWIEWRQEWERKLAGTEIQFLRAVSDLQGAWQHRVTLVEDHHRQYLTEHTSRLHSAFQASLDRATTEIQQRLWADLDRIRVEYETIIHAELRLLRQKTQVGKAGAELVQQAGPAAGSFAPVDWLKFGEKFRGTEAYVKRHLHIYVERFTGTAEILDIGCGRGELLEVLRDAGLTARGIDLNDDCVALCLSKGLAIEKADLFTHLEGLADASLGVVSCLQVVEHLPPDRMPEFVALVQRKLKTGGIFAVETPNPECLAIFAKHFYLDPTHVKPLPPALMAFYLEEAGFGRLETIRLEPAIESLPALASLPEDFRNEFFGSLDYAIFGRKL